MITHSGIVRCGFQTVYSLTHGRCMRVIHWSQAIKYQVPTIATIPLHPEFIPLSPTTGMAPGLVQGRALERFLMIMQLKLRASANRYAWC